MQNKANVKIGNMNITSAITLNYINELRTTNYELIMKTKPNKPNFKIGKMNITSAITVNYINELRTTNYERLCKTKPIKPNFDGGGCKTNVNFFAEKGL